MKKFYFLFQSLSADDKRLGECAIINSSCIVTAIVRVDPIAQLLASQKNAARTENKNKNKNNINF